MTGVDRPVLNRSTGTSWSWAPVNVGGSLIEVRVRLTPAGAAELTGCGGWSSRETRGRVRAAVINSG